MEEMMEILIKCGKISMDDVIEAGIMRKKEAILEVLEQMPKITERKKGEVTQFYTVIPAKLSKTGKRHQIVRKTYSECERAAIDEMHDTIARKSVDELTIDDVVEEFLVYKKNMVKPQTYNDYIKTHKRFIKNAFGQSKIKEIRLPECEMYISQLYNNGTPKSMILKVKTLLRLVFDYAIAKDYVLRNYFQAIQIKENANRPTQTRKVEAWTNEEIKTLWDKSLSYWKNEKKFRHSATMMLQIFTGCRAGEILGARWADVDWENRVLNIERTAVQYRDQESGKFIVTTGTTKTAGSRRKIFLNDAAIFWLKEIQRRGEEAGIASEYIATTKNGTTISVSHFDDRIKWFCNKVGVKYKPSHSNRRTYATAMIDAGVPVTEISADLGHQNVSTTQRSYYKKRMDAEKIRDVKNNVILATVGNRL